MDKPSVEERVLTAQRDVVLACARNYKDSEIGISFNGGKDSVVTVQLILDCVGIERVRNMKFFNFEEAEEFVEMKEFRKKYLEDLGVEIFSVDHMIGMKNGLWVVHEKFGLKAVFMGTRHDDPAGAYQEGAVSPCTTGWPPMVRYCPVFHWSFEEVWSFIRARGLPYCILYEQGYTSLGDRSTTIQNPDLLVDGSYIPAWELKDGSHERSGRMRRCRF